MIDLKVTLNLRGINTLMTSAAVQQDLDARGKRMAAAAGSEFEYASMPHPWTARGYVRPKSARGRRQEAREKRLTRSIDAGRELTDAETMAVEFLYDRAPASPTSTKVPAERPARFTRVWRTGGAAINRVLDEPIITATCTASDSVTASEDAQRARHVFLNDTFAVRLRIRAARR